MLYFLYIFCTFSVVTATHGSEAQRTDLDWGIIGTTHSSSYEDENMDPIRPSHHVITCSILGSTVTAERNLRFVIKTTVKEIFRPVDFSKIFELDFKDNSRENAMSGEDHEFLKKMSSGIHKTAEGHYQMPLPFKGNKTPNLPDNLPDAS